MFPLKLAADDLCNNLHRSINELIKKDLVVDEVMS